MPRKTRKQKQRATKRRAAQSSFQAQDKGLVKREFEFSSELEKSTKRTQKITKKADKSALLYEPNLVVRDIRKTLLLALGVFSLEIVIYLVWFRV